MKLTPIDIEQQKFRSRLRGYDTREVHHFLEMVASQIAELNRDVSELRGEVARKNREVDELRNRESSLRDAMLTAQRALDDLRETAQKEARLVLHEAELRSEKILQNAHARAMQIQQEISDLRRQRVRFLEELRGVVKTHERLIEVHDEELREPAEAGLTLLERLRAPEPPDLAGGMGDDVVGEISQ